MQWSRVAPVETGATSLVSLLSCLMATLRVGCTGFNRCCVAGFCASRQSAMQWNRVAPVETGATPLVLSLSCLMATLRVGCTG